MRKKENMCTKIYAQELVFSSSTRRPKTCVFQTKRPVTQRLRKQPLALDVVVLERYAANEMQATNAGCEGGKSLDAHLRDERIFKQ